MSASISTAFRQAHDWHPEPAPEAEDEALPSAADVAVSILLVIAEDPLLRPSQRMRARRYLRRLEQHQAAA